MSKVRARVLAARLTSADAEGVSKHLSMEWVR